MTMVFVHGAGRGGRDAWPRQQDLSTDPTATRWLDWPESAGPSTRQVDDLVQAQVDAVLAAPGGHADVLAHSHGAVAALAAAQQSAGAVRSLVLFEPACFGLARGRAAVEEHIAAMTPVFTCAADAQVDDIDYARGFFTALGAPAPSADTEEQQVALRRLRTVPVPWATLLDHTVLRRIPTLVITGGWLPLYEETAQALSQAGAQHLVLPGHGHRPHDHPDANDVIRDFHAAA